EARFRLFDAVATFLAASAMAQPLVVLLDDLHWADRPSLMLLQYLAREMGECRLLLLGTYRDVELTRQHPLARVLGDLARAPLCERILLQGLGPDDVGRFLAARAGGPPSPALLSAVVEMTEGNPFFLEEVARLLESEGRLRPGDADEPQRWGVLLPQSVREAIGRRLDALSPMCNRVLAVASVVGRDFDVALLERIIAAAGAGALDGEGPLPRAEILAALDEAVAARLAAVEPPALGRYAFAHALVRQTLYAELSTPLRLRLHQRVADVLEALHAADLEPHLAELAHHLFQAAAAGGAARAADFGLRAGLRAQASLAYEDAVLHCERALQLLELNPEAGSLEQRVELLLALADAYSAAGVREQSRAACRRAATLARTLDRPDLLARAALLFGQRTEAGPLPAEELRMLLEQSLAALGEREPALRSRLLSHLSSVPPYQDSIDTRADLCRQAVDLARQSGDLTALFDAQAAQLWTLLGPDHDRARRLAASELAQLAERTGQGERRLLPMEHRAASFLFSGDLAAADRETAAYQRLADELRQPSFVLIGKWYWVARALCDGRFADAATLMRECFDLGRRLQHPASSGVLQWHVYWWLRLRGNLGDYGQATDEIVATYGEVLVLPGDFRTGVESVTRQFYFNSPFLPAITAYVYAAIGAADDARRAFDELARHEFADIGRDEWWMPTITHLAELAAGFGDARRCRALQALLEPFAACNAVSPLLRTYGGSVAHYLGVLAAAQRQRDVAAGYFETALATNLALGARPALVGTQIEYGRLLLTRGRRAEERRGRALLQQALASALELGLTGIAASIPKEIINIP
ncbi:MAG: ATP-binding protein, partial [Candidatus Binatia bacterium]